MKDLKTKQLNWRTKKTLSTVNKDAEIILSDGTHINAQDIAKIADMAPENFDTLKEVADWIENHQEEVATMLNGIEDLKDKTTAIQDALSVKQYFETGQLYYNDNEKSLALHVSGSSYFQTSNPVQLQKDQTIKINCTYNSGSGGCWVLKCKTYSDGQSCEVLERISWAGIHDIDYEYTATEDCYIMLCKNTTPDHDYSSDSYIKMVTADYTATRLATDLSNIDEEGVERIKEFVGDIAFKEERIEISLSADFGVINWLGKNVKITVGSTEKIRPLDAHGHLVLWVRFGETYTITFPEVEGYNAVEPVSYTAEEYVRVVAARYRKHYDDLRDVARSFVVEASASSRCELTGSEEVIDRILSHGAFVIDETNKKYARLSERDSNTFEDGTPWSGVFGNAFRYLPQIYVLRDKDYADGGTKYWVSDEPIGDAEALPESWIGMYKGAVVSGELRSMPNVTTTGSMTMSNFWAAAQKLGTNYGLVNYFDHQKLNALHLVKFGDMNSDNTVGIGLRDAGSNYANHRTGTTAALGNGTGNAPYLSTQFDMVRLFGIEDLFGTTWEFRPNIRFDGGNAIVYDGNIVSNTAEGKRIFGRLQSTNGSFVKNMALGDNFDLIPIVSSGGSATTYWCDGVWATGSGQSLAVGGNTNSGLYSGLSCTISNIAFSHNATSYCARLAFKGDISDYELVSGADLAALHS